MHQKPSCRALRVKPVSRQLSRVSYTNTQNGQESRLGSPEVDRRKQPRSPWSAIFHVRLAHLIELAQFFLIDESGNPEFSLLYIY